ncbi:MAG TPA: DUF3006 family protein [Gemmatimonadaceae bacterium]|nr:DUF3006 family protein [Gemmatimonadaceae bacterium]
MARPSRRDEHVLIVEQWLDDQMANVELDGERMVQLPRALLPHDAAPDVVLRVVREQAESRIVVDAEGTRAARKESAARVDRLRRRDPGGDVSL